MMNPSYICGYSGATYRFLVSTAFVPLPDYAKLHIHLIDFVWEHIIQIHFSFL